MRLSLLQRLENAHEDSIWTIAWSRANNMLVTGSVDESVKIWQETGDTLELRHNLSGVTMGAVSIAIDSTGTYGVVNSLDTSINVFTMTDFSTVIPTLKLPPSEGWSVSFMPRSSPEDPINLALAGGSSNCIKILDVGPLQDQHAQRERSSIEMPASRASAHQEDGENDQGIERKQKQRTERFVLSIAVSPDGRVLAAGSMDGTVALFDTASSSLIHRLDPGHFKPVRSLSFTPDGKQLLTACDDMHIGMYDVNSGTLVESFSGHESWVLSVAPHPDGTAFASGGSDGKVKLWDARSRTCVQTCSEHEDQVWGVAWRGDGSRLASVSDDRSICLFDFA